MIGDKDFWDYLKEGFLNLLYPYSCANCGKVIKESKGYAICEDCFSGFKIISPPYCYRCGKPLSSMVYFEEKVSCSDCLNEKIHFDFCRSVAYYQGVIRKCIHLLKFKKQVKLVQPLGDLMIDYLMKTQTIPIKNIDLIVPVPLSRKDYLKRGYNQSGLLAGYIAEHFSIPFTEQLLVKIRDNLSQVGLSKKDRKKNVKEVYAINRSYANHFTNVLLIDDIYTTGATVKACSRELKKIRVKDLSVLTLARGV